MNKCRRFDINTSAKPMDVMSLWAILMKPLNQVKPAGI